MHDAFSLGSILEKVKSRPQDEAALLCEAAVLVSRKCDDPLTANDLLRMEDHLKSLSQHQGVIARVTGFFTLVNLMWLFAIAGITISLGPSVYHILKPLREYLRRLWRWLFDDVIVPMTIRFHNWGVIEVVLWLLLCGLQVDSESAFVKETGKFIAITSLALSIPCFLYSTFIWTASLPDPENEKTLPRLLALWIFTTTAPLAVLFDSGLLAYASVISFYAVLGFSVCFFGLGVAIGFDGKSSMSRVSFTSAVLLVFHTIVREVAKFGILGQEDIDHIRIFESPIAVMGCLTLYLALLIMSSKFYHYKGKWSDSKEKRQQRHFKQNMLMIVSLFLGILTGALTGSKGMLNTAITFFVLYVGERYAEFHLENKWNGWILVFCGSVCMYEIALWLHNNPEFLVSVFGG